MDQTIYVWDLATWRERLVLEHAGGIAAFSPDRKTLATGGSQATISLRDLATGKVKATLPGGAGPLAFSPDGRTLASGGARGGGTVLLWDVATRQRRATLKSHFSWLESIAFSPDGRLLASAGFDWEVKLWNAATGQPRAVLHGPGEQWIRSVAFSPDGRTLASAGSAGTVRLWAVPAK